MSVQNISSVNSVNFKGDNNNNKDINTIKSQNNIKDGKKKLALALAALGTVAIAGIAIYRGRGAKLSNVNFSEGMAFSKNGDKFTGTIKDKLADGDKIVMEYTDGILQKSTRSGKVNFEKVYETVNNEKIVKKTADGVTTEFNITKTQQEVKTAQEKLRNKVVEEAAQVAQKPVETIEKYAPAEAAVEEAVNKLSGNADERIAALKNNGIYATTLSKATPEELAALKNLKPEILEQIGDYSLASYLRGDVEAITTTLNGVSSETLEALNKIGIDTETLVIGLASAGKKPTTENILKKLKKRHFGFNPANVDMDALLQSDMQKYESQFKRVKLLDKIFTPDSIRTLNGHSKMNLEIWLRGNVAHEPFGIEDGQFFHSFWDALNKEFKVDDCSSKIAEIARQL